VIRKRLIILFVLQIAAVLLVSGFILRYQLQHILEKELGEKLQAIAASVAVQMDASLITLLSPGDEDTRVYRMFQRQLLQVKRASRMQRITIFSAAGNIWLDTEPGSVIGSQYARADFDRVEINRVLKGQSISSVLFEGSDGEPYKTGYAPLMFDGRPVGVIAVQGSAGSLHAIKDIQKTLLQIGVFALLFSFVLALLSSRQITRPLNKLQAAARRIGSGNLNESIAPEGKDEIAFLARTMEEMRTAILQRDEQQKAMLAGVAHEIRNPLGGIELFAGLLLDDVKDADVRLRVEKILKETQNLKALIQNFLDYARPVTAKPQACELREIWTEVQELLASQLAEKEVDVRCRGSAVVHADPQHVKQILLNLALNSVQAMAKGKQNSIELQIEEHDDQVRILFRDTGQGIPEGARVRIFDPFFSSKAKGLGLGLAIVRDLVQKNFGDITLQQSGPNGTTFMVELRPFRNEIK